MPKASFSRSRPLTITAEPGLRFLRLGRGGALEIASSPRVEILIEDASAFLNELLRALASSETGARLAIAAAAIHPPSTVRQSGEAHELRLALELAPGRHLDIALPAPAVSMDGPVAQEID